MTQQLLTHVDEPEVVEEHTHEACFTEDGIQYCVCGTHFRKLTCDNGVWHPFSSWWEDGSCPCERATREEEVPIVVETKHAHPNGSGRKENRSCHRRPMIRR